MRSSRQSGGTPTWFVLLLAIALVFGVYYIFAGARDFFGSFAQEQDATLTAQANVTSTVFVATGTARIATLRPSATPIPECQDFIVIVQSAILRDQPTTAGAIEGSVDYETVICVLDVAPQQADWYLVDTNPVTRRIDIAYIRNDLVLPANPTPVPSNTFVVPPSVTPLPTLVVTPRSSANG